MMKFVKVEDKSKEVEIILPSEDQFKMKLMKSLGNQYLIIKSQNKYCSIDFGIINRYNLKMIHLEHKKRAIKSTSYPSTIINQSKLLSFERNYENAIMVWEYIDALKYLEYSKDLLNLETMKVKNQECYFFANYLLQNSYDDLVATIFKKLK